MRVLFFPEQQLPRLPLGGAPYTTPPYTLRPTYTLGVRAGRRGTLRKIGPALHHYTQIALAGRALSCTLLSRYLLQPNILGILHPNFRCKGVRIGTFLAVSRAFQPLHRGCNQGVRCRVWV